MYLPQICIQHTDSKEVVLVHIFTGLFKFVWSLKTLHILLLLLRNLKTRFGAFVGVRNHQYNKGHTWKDHSRLERRIDLKMESEVLSFLNGGTEFQAPI